MNNEWQALFSAIGREAQMATSVPRLPAGVPGFIFVLVGVWRFLLPYFYEGDPRPLETESGRRTRIVSTGFLNNSILNRLEA
jgi:hypothetical protein